MDCAGILCENTVKSTTYRKYCPEARNYVDNSYREMTMPSTEEKTPLDNLKEKFRALFTPGSPQKKKDGLPPKAHFSIWYFLIAFLLITYLQQHFFSPKVETIPYSEFKQNLVAGNVTKLIVGPENITGTLKGIDKREGAGLHHDSGG